MFLDACDDNPCRNGGTCESEDNTYFFCHCPVGFGGPICIDKGILTRIFVRVYQLVARIFVAPSFCRHTKYLSFTLVYPCDSSPCQNDAICENNGAGFICTCRQGYKGFLCDKKGIFFQKFFLTIVLIFLFIMEMPSISLSLYSCHKLIYLLAIFVFDFMFIYFSSSQSM